MKKLLNQIFRFCFVGGTAFIIDFIMLGLLTEKLQINYLFSNVIAFSTSTVYNYFMSVYWVFNVNKTENKTKRLPLFVLFSLIGLGINQLIMFVTVESFELNYMIAKVVATVIVMIFNFVTRKTFLENSCKIQ